MRRSRVPLVVAGVSALVATIFFTIQVLLAGSFEAARRQTEVLLGVVLQCTIIASIPGAAAWIWTTAYGRISKMVQDIKTWQQLTRTLASARIEFEMKDELARLTGNLPVTPDTIPSDRPEFDLGQYQAVAEELFHFLYAQVKKNLQISEFERRQQAARLHQIIMDEMDAAVRRAQNHKFTRPQRQKMRVLYDKLHRSDRL